jgi:hypothetical protein
MAAMAEPGSELDDTLTATLKTSVALEPTVSLMPTTSGSSRPTASNEAT